MGREATNTMKTGLLCHISRPGRPYYGQGSRFDDPPERNELGTEFLIPTYSYHTSGPEVVAPDPNTPKHALPLPGSCASRWFKCLGRRVTCAMDPLLGLVRGAEHQLAPRSPGLHVGSDFGESLRSLGTSHRMDNRTPILV